MFKTLLVGNGICRAINQVSNDKVIEDIRKDSGVDISDSAIRGLPFPEKVVVCSKDNVDKCMRKLANSMKNVSLSYDDMGFIKTIFSNNTNAILTTNYSYEIENAFLGKYTSYQYKIHRRLTKECKDTEKRSHLFQYTDLSDAGLRSSVWHIHGEAYYPNSMIMGHYYYGKLLKNIQDYIPNLIQRYKRSKNNGIKFTPLSWIDYFMIGDLHIIGLSMDFAEADLWRLLCCKKRNFENSKTYFHEANPEDIYNTSKYYLMKAYSVEIVCPEELDYKKYYQDVFCSI